ncbi:NAD-dependent epimerase/dehydratase family protein [Pelagibius marinus]|uniref:NAD-dependent epimerase/dehydratase family protein n=1 Tax=Pelagibius marinus TaxID=2762760 RepID=UPI00187302C9|nr:NAD(P)-dependent oxidoreductase [Pelagibius marinus]
MNDAITPRGSVALTGGSGFVGGHILRRLVAEGWQVRALTRRPDGLPPVEGAPPGSVTAIPGDLESSEALAELVAGADAVIHCAGLVAARRRADFLRVNAEGTAALLRALEAGRQAGGPAPRFVLISSLAAREPQLSPYADSKRQAEEALRRLGAGLDWRVLRPAVVYGPGDRATLPLFRQFLRGLALVPGGSGRFSMIYVEDLAAAAVAALAPELPAGGFLGPDDGTAGGYGWAEVLAAAGRLAGRPVRAVTVPRVLQRLAAALSTAGALVSGRPAVLSQGKVNEFGHPDWVCRPQPPGAPSLSDCISWRPAVGLDEGFSKTVAWYKAAGWL